MLPDLPNLKHDIQLLFDRYLKAQVNARLGVFNESPKHCIQEGNRMRIIRTDGSIDESQLKEASAEMSIKCNEIPQLTPDKRILMLNETAEEMARQISTHLFGTLNETLDRAGQVVDYKGKPLDAEAVFALLESVQIDFDETGKHKNLSIVLAPALLPKAKEVFVDRQEI